MNSPRERYGSADASIKGKKGERNNILEEHLGLFSVLERLIGLDS
jgi:hypothetical protein